MHQAKIACQRLCKYKVMEHQCCKDIFDLSLISLSKMDTSMCNSGIEMFVGLKRGGKPQILYFAVSVTKILAMMFGKCLDYLILLPLQAGRKDLCLVVSWWVQHFAFVFVPHQLSHKFQSMVLWHVAFSPQNEWISVCSCHDTNLQVMDMWNRADRLKSERIGGQIPTSSARSLRRYHSRS